jgi:DNA invertase Pin-like site-specific DNA recombinase
MLLGYARAGTRDDLQRQVEALKRAQIPARRIYADPAPSRRERPRRDDVLAKTRPGDVIVAETLAPLGLTIRETLMLVRQLAARGVGVRTLTGPALLDTSDVESVSARQALAMLELVEELDATYARERIGVNRRRADAEGRRLGRRYAEDSAEDAARFARARQLRLDGFRVLTISRRWASRPIP